MAINYTFGQGHNRVASSGTPIPVLGTQQDVDVLIIQAFDDNTGNIWVGGSGVSAATRSGIAVTPGSAFTIPAGQINSVFVDADVSNEGYSFMWSKSN